MTSAPTNPNNSSNAIVNGNAITLYDATGHQVNIVAQAGTVTQDSTTGIYYAPLQAVLSSDVTINIGQVELLDGGGTNKLAIDSSGRLTLIPNSSINVAQLNGVTTQMAGSDGVTSANMLETAQGLFNGTTTDQMRGNLDNITVLASASRTTTQTQSDQTNYNHKGIIVVLDMTVAGASPSVTLEIDGKDPVSGKYYAILTGAAVTTVTTNVYKVYPGVTTGANAAVSDVLPRTYRIKVTANNANAGTYSVGAMLIL